MNKNYGNKLLKGTFVIIIVGIFAKMASFIAEAVLAAYLGTTYQSDAYYTVWSLHGVVYPMMSIGIWKVFLPLYKNHIAKQENELAYGLTNRALCFFTAISLIVVIFIILFAPFVVSVIAPGFDEVTRALCIKMVRISAPMYLFIVPSAIYASVLQCHDKFFGSQIREVMSHIPIIIAAFFFYNVFGIEALAIALVVAGVLRLLIEVPFVNWGYRFKVDYKFKNKEFVLMLRRLPSAVVTAGVAQVNTLVDKVMASTLPTGTISGLNYGHKLMNVFSGLLSSAIATAMYPQMIELISLGKKKELGQLVTKIVNVFLVLMMPITLACALFRIELVSVVFQRGAFDASSTLLTANIFAIYCIGLFFIACNNVISNIFYGHGDTRNEMHISITGVATNVLLNIIFIQPFGVNGLAFATSLSAIFAFFVRFIFVRKYVKLKSTLMITVCLKVIIASVIACMIPRIIFWFYPANRYVVLGVSIVLGIGIYLNLIKWLGINEINDFINKIKNKLKK